MSMSEPLTSSIRLQIEGSKLGHPLYLDKFIMPFHRAFWYLMASLFSFEE